MSGADADAALRRFERDAVGACLAMALVAFAWVALAQGVGAAARAALGVVGGGLLTGFSYRAIRGGVDALLVIAADAGAARQRAGAGRNGPQAADEGGGSDAGEAERGTSGTAPEVTAPAVLSFGRKAFLAVKFFTRYALLAVAAYVMLTCFRLDPVGVLAGATAPFLAAVMQIGRLSRAGGDEPRR